VRGPWKRRTDAFSLGGEFTWKKDLISANQRNRKSNHGILSLGNALATPGAGEHHSHIRRKIDAAIPQLLFSLGLWLLESFCGLTLFGTAELYKSNDWQ
jgi:hypothetical protein